MNRWVLVRRLHVSWLIAIFCLALLGGVSFVRYISPTIFSSVAWLIIGIILTSIVLWRRYVYLIPIIIMAGLMIGLWRGSLQQSALSKFASYYNKQVIVSGNVREDIDTNASGQLVIRLDHLSVGGQALDGALWITAVTKADIKRSDKITVEGKISPGFGSFAGTMYETKIDEVVRPEPGDIARNVRDWFADAIRKVIPDPEASLGIGYLVGQKRALPADLVSALQIAGLTHVVVASGYNLTILVRLARRLFVRISKYLSALSAGAMIVAFMAVTGLSPSMSRAGLVSGLSLLAWYYGRRFHPIILISLAASVTTMINPSYAWGDLGWQLSFAAFAGVMILAPLLQSYFFGDKKPGTIRQILGETISATIVTAPILIGAFGQISNVSLIANLLVLPLVPLAMLLTFIAGIGALVLPAIASFIALPATWLLGYMVWVAKGISSVPWAVSVINLSNLGIIICYLVLIAICIYLWRVTKYSLRDSNIVE